MLRMHAAAAEAGRLSLLRRLLHRRRTSAPRILKTKGADSPPPSRNRLLNLLIDRRHAIGERVYASTRAYCAKRLNLHTHGAQVQEVWERGVWATAKMLHLPAGKVKPLFPNEAIFDQYVREAAAKYSVTVPLIKAVIAKESSFRPHVTRDEPHVKAPQYGIDGDRSYGLMQVLVSTARDRGYQGEPEGLLEPRTNVLVGTKHLAWLTKRYGDTTRVIAAYNAGSPRMSKVRIGEFENQDYVNKTTAWLKKFKAAEGANVVLASLTLPLLLLVLVYVLRR